MRINGLTLHNFRQYIGDQNLDLSVDDEKTVIMIVGKTGAGKSTLIDAITWCLYGRIGEGAEDDVDVSVLNEIVQQKMKNGDEEKASVELEISLKDDIYYIKREETFIKQSGRIKSTNVTENVNKKSGSKLTEHSKTEISEILPKAISKYFFFKGENLEDLGDPHNKRVRAEIKQGITSVLGMDILDEAIDHLNGARGQTGVIASFRNELDGTSEEMDKVGGQIVEIEGKITELTEENQKVSSEIDQYDASIAQIEAVLKTNRTTREIQNEISRIREEKDQCAKDLEVFYSLYIQEISTGTEQILINKLAYKAIPILLKNPTVGEGVPGMHADSIDFLLKRGKCICGTDLKNNSDLQNHLVREKRLLPPESIGITVHGFRTMADQYNDDEGAFKAIKEAYGHLVDKREDIIKKEKEIKNKVKELNTTEDLAEMAGQLEIYYDKKIQLTEKKGGNSREIEGLNSRLGPLKRRHDELARQNSKNIVAIECRKMAETILQAFLSYRDAKRKKITDELSDLLNEAFQAMYADNQNKVIEIDQEKFDVSLYYITPDMTKKKLSINEGQKVVLTCSYIASIITLARSYIGKKGEFLESDDYPLMMDAPFSKVDPEHIERVADYMTKHSAQWIILVNPKDWSASQQCLKDKIKTVYEIDKQSSVKSFITKMEG